MSNENFDFQSDAFKKFLEQYGLNLDPNAVPIDQFAQQLQRIFTDMGGKQASGDQAEAIWTMTKDQVRKAVKDLGSDPEPSSQIQLAIQDADRLANSWLDELISFDPITTPAQGWTRSQWVEQTMDSWRAIVEPIGTQIGVSLAAGLRSRFGLAGEAEMISFMQVLEPILRQSAQAMYAQEFSGAVLKLVKSLLTAGQTNLQLLSKPQVVLLAANIDEFAQGLGISDDDVRLYLTVREVARQRLFNGVGWLAPQMLALVEHYAREIQIDPDAIITSMGSADLGSIDFNQLQQLSIELQGSLFTPTRTDEQIQILHRLETLLALIEGWVDFVAGQATERWMPHVKDALGEALTRHLAATDSISQLFTTLMGLELRPRRVRDAMNFWAVFTHHGSVVDRDKKWSHPDLIPTSEDLDDPLAAVERDGQASDSDELDQALAQLLDEETRRHDDEG